MNNFEFRNARTIEEAVSFLKEFGEKALIVAGGTGILPDIRAGKINEAVLVNIHDIRELKGISFTDGVITIGALTTIHEISQSDVIKENAPALYMASQVFADPTVRHSATIGGNIANAAPSADTAAPLLALNANVKAISSRGERIIPIDQWFLGPRQTSLAPDELVTGFSFVPAKSAFYKLGSRKSMAISIVSAAAAVELNNDNTVKSIRIAMGSVGPKTTRAVNAEKVLIGKALTDETFAAMNEALQDAIDPNAGSIRASISYLRQVAPVCVKRAILKACFGECK